MGKAVTDQYVIKTIRMELELKERRGMEKMMSRRCGVNNLIFWHVGETSSFCCFPERSQKEEWTTCRKVKLSKKQVPGAPFKCKIPLIDEIFDSWGFWLPFSFLISLWLPYFPMTLWTSILHCKYLLIHPVSTVAFWTEVTDLNHFCILVLNTKLLY